MSRHAWWTGALYIVEEVALGAGNTRAGAHRILGEGALGHPRVFINLDRGGPVPCLYCGLRYEQKHHDH